MKARDLGSWRNEGSPGQGANSPRGLRGQRKPHFKLRTVCMSEFKTQGEKVFKRSRLLGLAGILGRLSSG